ncbi:MAG: hypothetical protein ABI947_07825 [Chloroflexota bacterium]
MIQVTKTYKCRVCGSENIVKNGTNKVGQAQYHCKDCGAYRVLEPQPNNKGQRRKYVLLSYAESASLRGLTRIYGVARQTALKWIQVPVQNLPGLIQSVLPSSAVMYGKSRSGGLSSSARTIKSGGGLPCVADHTRLSLSCLATAVWQAVVPTVISAYQAVLPERTHHAVGKETGQTAHQERWHCTLRQRLGRLRVQNPVLFQSWPQS